MSIFDILSGGLMGGAATPGINGPSPAQGDFLGGLMSDPSKMAQLQMAASILEASRGRPGEGRPGLGAIAGAGARGALQGGMMANQMQMQQLQMGKLKDDVERARENKKRYEEFVSSPDFQQLPPEVQQAIQAGGPDMLAQYHKGNVEAATQGPPDAVRQYQYAQQDPAFADYQMQLKRAGRTTVTNNIDTSGNAFAKEFGKANAQQFMERRQGALDAAASLKANQEAINLLDSGVITGFGADYAVGLGKALQQAGINLAPDAIANTEAFVATRAQEVGRIIKLFGAGTGLSDADREFATKAAAGKIDMTEDSIRRVLDINNRAYRNVIEAYNKDALALPQSISPYPMTVDIPQVGPAAPWPQQDEDLLRKYGVE